MDMRDVGCAGFDCPKRERCARFQEEDCRDLSFKSPPYNKYEDKVACNYYEPYKEED